MKRFKNVLLVSDLKSRNKNALDRALMLASRNHARLTIVDFIDEVPEYVRAVITPARAAILQKHAFETRKKYLEAEIESIRPKGLKISCQVLEGRAFIKIIRKVLRDKHDLVIMPAEAKSGLREQIFGSTTMHLMRKCPCPVWVVKPTRSKTYFHILACVALDEFGDSISPLNIKIMDLATSLAQWENSDLHITYVWKIHGQSYLEGLSENEVRNLARETRSEFRVKMNNLLANYDLKRLQTHVHLKQGSVIEAIPEMVKTHHIDLIVMGTVSRSGLAGLLIGNTAEEVLRRVDCSVLTVKPEGFVSPVQDR